MSYTPSPYSGQLADLPGYVERELGAISLEFGRALGSGSLYLDPLNSPAPARSIPAAAVLFDDFDGVTPGRGLQGVDPRLPGTLWIREAGLWAISFAISAALAVSEEVELLVLVDGIRSAAYGVVSTDNKALTISVGSVYMARFSGAAGTGRVELWVRSLTAPAAWTTVAATFVAWRVGD